MKAKRKKDELKIKINEILAQHDKCHIRCQDTRMSNIMSNAMLRHHNKRHDNKQVEVNCRK